MHLKGYQCTRGYMIIVGTHRENAGFNVLSRYILPTSFTQLSFFLEALFSLNTLHTPYHSGGAFCSELCSSP